MEQLGKICRHHCKGRLKINKIAKFESDASLASNYIAINLRKFTVICMVGGTNFAHHQTKTSVEFCNFEEL